MELKDLVTVEDGMFIANVHGKIVKRTKMEHMEYALRKMGILPDVKGVLSHAGVQAGPYVREKSTFTVEERFDFISKFIKILVKGKINSFILTGSGGIGKTTLVMETLNNLGLLEDLPEDDGGDFMVVRGFSTPRALYDTLYKFRNKILVLDDADQVFKNNLGANLLKHALDDKKVRVINWNTAESDEDSDIPNRFTYSGKIIFVSNCTINAFPQPIISRSQTVDLTLNVEEMIEVISHVFKKIDNTKNVKDDVLEFVKEKAAKAKDLNIRTAVSLMTLRENFGPEWRRIAEYSFCR